MAPSVALISCPDFPALSTDEALLRPELEALGYEVHRLSWDQTERPWSDFSGLVLRSTWDYVERLEEFLAWVEHLETAAIPLWNPPELVRWNHEKRYLEDLEERGIPVVPTGWIEPGGLVHLHEIMAFEGWHEAVIKPVVSLGGQTTFRVDQAEARARDKEFRALVRDQAMMVQQLMPEIFKDGELSFCFFDGEFSHAVRKQPKDGEFRIQEAYGGTVKACEPDPGLIRQAEAVLEGIPGEWLYARVDAVVRKRNLILMELELVEPSLYLEYAPGSAKRFAAAIAKRLGS